MNIRTLVYLENSSHSPHLLVVFRNSFYFGVFMPIYEYECVECGHTLEKLQKISDEPLSDCPACGKSALQKLISAAGFRLKGGGWYETDFKTGSKKNVTGGEKPKSTTEKKPASSNKKSD